MLYAIGNPVYDEIYTPWVSTLGRVLSGCATNAALVYARLGGEVCLSGRVGHDSLDHYHRQLAHDGIHSDTEVTSETGGFKLVYDDRGRRTLNVLGVADPISRIEDRIDQAEIVFIGPVLQETPFPLIRHVRQRTKAPMVLDPQGLLRRIGSGGEIEHYKPDGIEDICAMCDVVKPNELETEILTGIDPRIDCESAAAVLKGWGIRTVAITLADLGSLIATDEGSYRIQAIPTLAIDSTGAGDSFAGGLMYARLQGKDWPDAARFATAVSTMMISHCGPYFPMTRSRIEQMAAGVKVSSRPALAVPGA